MSAKINDLRSALALLETLPDQLIETDVEPFGIEAKEYRRWNG